VPATFTPIELEGRFESESRLIMRAESKTICDRGALGSSREQCWQIDGHRAMVPRRVRICIQFCVKGSASRVRDRGGRDEGLPSMIIFVRYNFDTSCELKHTVHQIEAIVRIAVEGSGTIGILDRCGFG
jgi:hypothetical protein